MDLSSDIHVFISFCSLGHNEFIGKLFFVKNVFCTLIVQNKMT